MGWRVTGSGVLGQIGSGSPEGNVYNVAALLIRNVVRSWVVAASVASPIPIEEIHNRIIEQANKGNQSEHNGRKCDLEHGQTPPLPLKSETQGQVIVYLLNIGCFCETDRLGRTFRFGLNFNWGVFEHVKPLSQISSHYTQCHTHLVYSPEPKQHTNNSGDVLFP